MQRKGALCIALLGVLAAGKAHTQEEDLLNLVNKDSAQTTHVTSAFKSSRVIMSHSMEMLKPGILDFRILHRFGPVNSGASNLFGLDDASIRLGLDYAISRKLTVGIGRTSVPPRKDADAFVKDALLQQATGERAVPLSLIAVGGTTMQTAKWADKTRDYSFSRMGYYGQVILGRKFSEAFTLQLVPTFVHRNLVLLNADDNDTYALGTGGRIRLSRRVNFTFDYYYVFNKDVSLNTYNPLSLGFDIETGGHVFQLHFTNAIGMNERSFVTETTYDWGEGDIQFGFNISRAFQLGKKSKGKAKW